MALTAPAAAPGAVAPAPAAWTNYCRACGTALNPHAAICMSCGAAAAPLGPHGAPLAPAQPRQKATAVVLAVLFGLFGWLYTYKRDAWKFWLNLALTVVTIGIWGLIAWVWAIIDMAVRPSHWYEQFPNGH
jgi:hypothetical protein